MVSFMDEYRAGRLDGTDLAERIVYWHTFIDASPGAAGLEEYLGMTWAEFTCWWFTDRLPQRVVQSAVGASPGRRLRRTQGIAS
jgi:hypothetical protein